ncbi:MAG: GtrA family protein [Candidatus Komeilibacteria bacterium]|nr:GtrA family protein [Candidatus Komeilibacteria bacterium]
MKLLDQLEQLVFWLLPLPKKWQRFVRYSIVGGIATPVDFGIYFSLTRLIPWFTKFYLVANIFAFLGGTIVAYLFNRSWTFGQGVKFVWKQYVKFLVINLFTLIILQICFYIFVDVFHWYDLIAKVLLLAISIGINFSLNSFWTFRRSE